MIKDSDRLQMVIDALRISSNAFSVKLGYRSPGTVYHVLKGQNNLSDGMIDKIVFTFPEVSYPFLKKGEGEVILSPEEQKNQMNLLNIRKPNSTFEEIEIDDPNFLLMQKMDVMIYYQKKTYEMLEAILNK